MFLIKQTRSYKTRKCSNGCLKGIGILQELLPDFPQMKYCFSCGTEIIEEEFNYDVFLCSNCTKVVNADWHFCPYCGEAKVDITLIPM